MAREQRKERRSPGPGGNEASYGADGVMQRLIETGEKAVALQILSQMNESNFVLLSSARFAHRRRGATPR